MKKYRSLWKFIAAQEEAALTLTFAEVEKIAGVPMDHSFLNSKKEILEYGWRVKKIQIGKQTGSFERADKNEL